MKKILLFIFWFLFFAFSFSNQCSLQSLGLTDYKELYKDLKKPPVSNEDLGRYVWYWRREFTWGIIYDFFKIFNLTGCYSLYDDVEILCNNFEDILKFSTSIDQLRRNVSNLLDKIPQTTKWYDLLNNFLQDLNTLTGNNLSLNIVKQKFSNDILDISQYYQSKSIKFSEDKLYWPYQYLVPLNISYNRSLQNLSSYYTDIGFVWLIMWFLVLLGFIYSILTKNRLLFSLTLSNIFWFVVWWFVGSAILWYGIWIVIWTILSIVVFFYYLLEDLKSWRVIGYIVLIFLIVIFFWQLFLNFIRISSQWGSWPFVWYKESVWEKIVFDEMLQPKKQLKTPYKWQDVFDLQFPHYKKFIQTVNNRKEDENIFLAWTYARYFIDNQKWLVYDQMLTNLWRWMSDWDVCKSYLRLKEDKKFKYIAIDPNIWTVTNFENWGNKTLFDRFFGNINLDTWNLDERGVLTFLGKMEQSWYVKYFYSNNLSAKYWFILSDQQLINYLKRVNPNLNTISQNDLAILRGALVATRYPWVLKLTAKKFFNWQQYGLLNLVMVIAQDRVNNLDFIWDFADSIWKQVDADKLKKLVAVLLRWNQNLFIQASKKLTDDEKYVLANFLGLIQQLKREGVRPLQDIVMQSIFSSSQIFIVEIK